MESALHTPSELLLRIDPIVVPHAQEGRKAFGSLLESVGTGAFSGNVTDYLRTYLSIDKTIVTIFARDAAEPPELLLHNFDDPKACALYLSYIRHHCLPAAFADDGYGDAPVSVLDDPASPDARGFTRTLRAFLGIEAELRLAMPMDDGRVAMLLLGKAQWSPAESEVAVRCAAFLRPTIQAHARSRRDVPKPAGGDWRFDLVRKSFGDSRLTSREFAIAMRILNGDSTSMIADKLAISGATVKVHRRHIFAKLNISCQAELFALAFRDMRVR